MTFRNPFSGEGVVETVSCIRIQRRESADNVESESNNEPTCSKRLKVDSPNVQSSKGTLTENHKDSRDSPITNEEETQDHPSVEKCTVGYCTCKDFNSELQCGNSTKLERENVSLERRNPQRCESRGIQTDFDDDDDRGNERGGNEEIEDERGREQESEEEEEEEELEERNGQEEEIEEQEIELNEDNEEQEQVEEISENEDEVKNMEKYSNKYV